MNFNKPMGPYNNASSIKRCLKNPGYEKEIDIEANETKWSAASPNLTKTNTTGRGELYPNHYPNIHFSVRNALILPG